MEHSGAVLLRHLSSEAPEKDVAVDVAASLSRQLAKVVAPSSGTAEKQIYFLAFFLTFTVIVAISGESLVLAPPYLAALVLLLVATLLAYTVPWDRASPHVIVVVPLLDVAAIGLVRDLLREIGTATSLLALIPALWLAARLRARGAVIATVAVASAITVPTLLRADHIDSVTLAHAALLPFTVLQVGLLVTGALSVLDHQSERVTATLGEKEALLDAADIWKRRLENIIDSVDTGIVVVDRDGHDLLMNRVQRSIHRSALPSGIDDPDESRLLLHYPGTTQPIPPDRRPVRRAVLQESFSNYVVSVGPTGPGSGSYSTSARQIIDVHGERDGAVVVFTDVTQYIESARRQDQFVATVSHELRTPLTSVIGYLELARDDLDLSRETASFLDVAHRNADQLLSIVEELLRDQAARSGSGVLTLRPARVSDLLRESVESVALRADELGLTLEQDLEETPLQQIDASRMRQAIDNLVSNALKYTPRGGTVRVHTCFAESSVELAVTDTGIGMSDQEQTDLFTDYYRTRTALESDIPGHGIGLALTHRIVLAHGGQISVLSTPGSGSTFTIRLPISGNADGPRTSGRSAAA